MTALEPLEADQAMEPVAHESARSAVIHTLALPVLPIIHKAAVDGLAWTGAQLRAGWNVSVADEGLWCVAFGPGRAQYVGLDALSGVFGRQRSRGPSFGLSLHGQCGRG